MNLVKMERRIEYDPRKKLQKYKTRRPIVHPYHSSQSDEIVILTDNDSFFHENSPHVLHDGSLMLLNIGTRKGTNICRVLQEITSVQQCACYLYVSYYCSISTHFSITYDLSYVTSIQTSLTLEIMYNPISKRAINNSRGLQKM